MAALSGPPVLPTEGTVDMRKRRSLRLERILAFAIAIAANLGMGAYLLEVSPVVVNRTDSADVLQLAWVALPATPSRPTRQHPLRKRRFGTTPPAAWRPAAAAARTRPGAVPEAHASLPDDAWFNGPDRSIANNGDEPDFRREPLEARPPSMPDLRERVHFRVEDQSLAGRLARMGKRAACAELARALRESPASATAILASMTGYDCGRR